LSRTTEKFRRYKEEVKPIILELLEDHSFLSHRSVQLMLEQKNYWHTVTWNAIRDLKKDGKLRTAKYPTRGKHFPTWVYRSNLRISDIRAQIDMEFKPLYKDFIEASSAMGSHCEGIIEKAIGKAGFVALSRNQNTKYFRGKTCPDGKDLDVIAYEDGVFYGFEVKNLLAYPNWNEDIVKKKAVAEYHGIQFVMVSRTMGPYNWELFKCGGLYLEFNRLIWATNFSSLAKRLEEKLYFPIDCVDEPTEELIRKVKGVQHSHDIHFYGKGRIN
jgi:hypothetical protein